MWTAIALSGALGTGPTGDAPPPPRRPHPKAPVSSPFGEAPGPSPYRLRRGEGRGMVIAGAVLAGLSHVWLVGLEGAYAGDLVYEVKHCGGQMAIDDEACDLFSVSSMIYRGMNNGATMIRWLGVGLLGGGLSRYGASVRRSGLRANRSSLRRLRKRRDVGIAMLGVAAAVSLLDSVHLWAGFMCYSSGNPFACYRYIHVGSLVTSSATIGAGLALGPYADGYLREYARLRSVQVAPWSLPGGAGLAVGGRF